MFITLLSAQNKHILTNILCSSLFLCVFVSGQYLGNRLLWHTCLLQKQYMCKCFIISIFTVCLVDKIRTVLFREKLIALLCYSACCLCLVLCIKLLNSIYNSKLQLSTICNNTTIRLLSKQSFYKKKRGASYYYKLGSCAKFAVKSINVRRIY